jgi:small subunit ribosomal protein S10e
MFVTKKNRLAVYSYLFKEGTCVAHKDYSILGNHSEELAVSNIEVLALLKSLSSRGYVKETFNWRWFYYVLTEEGIAYLREYLAIPEEVSGVYTVCTLSTAVHTQCMHSCTHPMRACPCRPCLSRALQCMHPNADHLVHIPHPTHSPPLSTWV